jgi:hypothetical protein
MSEPNVMPVPTNKLNGNGRENKKKKIFGKGGKMSTWNPYNNQNEYLEPLQQPK